MLDKVRQSNYELMRITSMFFIVLWHILLHTEILNNSTGLLKQGSLILYLLLMVHTNSFMLLSGYFQYNKKNKAKKIFGLIGHTWFYNVIFMIIGLSIWNHSYDKLTILRVTSVLNIGGYWYITGHVLLMICSQIINKYINNSTKEEHKKVLIIFFIIFSIIPYITRNGAIANDGRSLIQFIFMYLIGAYLGKYPIEKSYHFKNNSINKNRLIYVSLFFSFMIINYLILQFGYSLKNYNGAIINDIYQTISYSRDSFANPFIILSTICYFLLFGTLNFKSKIINRISSLTLGIYLVHENPVVVNFLYKTIIPSVNYNDTLLLLFKFIIYSIILFIISGLIEFFRQIFTKLIKKLKITKFVLNKTEQFIKNF